MISLLIRDTPGIIKYAFDEHGLNITEDEIDCIRLSCQECSFTDEEIFDTMNSWMLNLAGKEDIRLELERETEKLRKLINRK